MAFGKPKEFDDDDDGVHRSQATVDLGGRYDRKLRACGAEIHGRPKKGQTTWKYEGHVYNESDLLRELKINH